MKKFRFTLQAVHVVRQQQERQALEHYARALAAQRRAEAALARRRAELADAWQRRRDMETSGAAALRLAQIQHYGAAVEDRCRECGQEVHKACEQTAQAWSLLAHARRQREAIEKLRRRQWLAHEHAALREEQKMLDELATTRFLNAGEALSPRAGQLAESIHL